MSGEPDGRGFRRERGMGLLGSIPQQSSTRNSAKRRNPALRTPGFRSLLSLRATGHLGGWSLPRLSPTDDCAARKRAILYSAAAQREAPTAAAGSLDRPWRRAAAKLRRRQWYLVRDLAPTRRLSARRASRRALRAEAKA